jgi:5-hydroxyisourate hydrolase
MPPHRQPTISTHVLDNERGQPAVGVQVTLERRHGDAFTTLTSATTDDDGRVGNLLPGPLQAGIYRIAFDAAGYFEAQDPNPPTGDGVPFLRSVAVEFQIVDTGRHYHVPLLMTRFACTSYRGS